MYMALFGESESDHVGNVAPLPFFGGGGAYLHIKLTPLHLTRSSYLHSHNLVDPTIVTKLTFWLLTPVLMRLPSLLQALDHLAKEVIN